jgi:hypothetical protein
MPLLAKGVFDGSTPFTGINSHQTTTFNVKLTFFIYFPYMMPFTAQRVSFMLFSMRFFLKWYYFTHNELPPLAAVQNT